MDRLIADVVVTEVKEGTGFGMGWDGVLLDGGFRMMIFGSFDLGWRW